MKTIKLLILYLLVLLGSCNKNNLTEAELIVGEWTWVETIGGFGGWTHTPESLGIEKFLVIDKEFLKEYENDSLVREVGYSTYIEESTMGSDTTTFINYERGNDQRITVIDTVLWLHDLCFDCNSYKYVRD